MSANIMSKIYVYTTAIYKKENWFKIGQTERDCATRINEQDVTSSAEALIQLDEWDASGKTDKAFHKFLESNGIRKTRDDKDREWFVVSDGLEEIKTLWNKFLFGVSRKNTYTLRNEQRVCVDKASSYLATHDQSIFLIDAKMRFGKTFTTYKIAEKLLSKNILIITWKPSVSDSWHSDLINHVDFDGWGWRRIGDSSNDVKANEGKPNVSFSSVQMIIAGGETEKNEDDFYDEDKSNESNTASEEVKFNSKTAEIFNTHWDLVVFDEVHYGERTNKMQAILDKLNKNHTLYLSGTPYKLIANYRFDSNSSFTWSYSDEQEAKKADQGLGSAKTGAYDMLPGMKRLLIELTGVKLLANLIKQYSDDEGFRIEKMLGVNKETGKFEDIPTVRNFIACLAKNGAARGYSPWGKMENIDNRMLDTTLWFLPSVASIHEMAAMLKANAFFCDFDIIQTSGENRNVKSITDLQNQIKANVKHGRKSIILACERFKEGITLPELGAVFMMNGWSSPESYYQASFRCQSPWAMTIDSVTGKVTEWKQECYVFDFNPSRALRLSYEYSDTESLKSMDSVKECLLRFHDNCPVLDNAGVTWKDSVKGALSFGLSKTPAERIASAFYIIKDNLMMLRSDLIGLTQSKRDTHSETINNEVNKGKIFQPTINTNPNLLPILETSAPDAEVIISIKEKKDALKEMVEKIQSILMKLPTIVFCYPDSQLDSCKSIVDNAPDGGFESITKVSKSTFVEMIKLGIVSDYHDKCLLEYSLRLRNIGK